MLYRIPKDKAIDKAAFSKYLDLESPDGDVALDADQLGDIVAGDALLGDGDLGVGDQRQGQVVGDGEEGGHHWTQIQAVALQDNSELCPEQQKVSRYTRTSEHSGLLENVTAGILVSTRESNDHTSQRNCVDCGLCG